MQTHSLPRTARAVLEARQVIADPNIAATLSEARRRMAWMIAARHRGSICRQHPQPAPLWENR